MGRRFSKRLRQSHRSVFPTTDFSRGITNTEQKQAHEYTGLLFVLCALMNNGDAWDMIKNALTRKGLEIDKVLQLFECLLVFDSWCKQDLYWTHDAMDVEQANAQQAIRTMLMTLKETLPRNTGNGWA